MTQNHLDINMQVLSTPNDFFMVEELQSLIWGESDVVPAHLMLAIARNGGFALGAFDGDRLLGFIYGFVGLHQEDGSIELKHCSHQLGVHPDYRDSGLGFLLKQAQWQLARKQGLELITWTYDPLESRNAYFNISKLGAICNTYIQDYYGEMDDELNAGMPTDRFQVELWTNSRRVVNRMLEKGIRSLTLDQYFAGNTEIINTTEVTQAGFITPLQDKMDEIEDENSRPNLSLFEIPPNFQALKTEDIELAVSWRIYSRAMFELYFYNGYIVTDFVYQPGENPRSFYLLSHGDAKLGRGG